MSVSDACRESGKCAGSLARLAESLCCVRGFWVDLSKLGNPKPQFPKGEAPQFSTPMTEHSQTLRICFLCCWVGGVHRCVSSLDRKLNSATRPTPQRSRALPHPQSPQNAHKPFIPRTSILELPRLPSPWSWQWAERIWVLVKGFNLRYQIWDL